MANPWSILGLRKSSDEDQLWRGYVRTLREVSTDAQRRRARDAFEAINLGLWGKFADSVEPEDPDPARKDRGASAYEGPLAGELDRLGQLLSCPGTIDPMAVRDRIEAVFDDPAMQQASIYLRVEPALAELLEEHLPQSEPFMLLALDRFHHLTDQARKHGALARMLDRADELSLLDALDTGQAELSKGWRSLAKPASHLRRSLWAVDSDRRRRIAALYAYAGWHNPRFRRRLDDGEWSWWSRELSRERTPFVALLVWLLAAFLMGAAADHHRASLPTAATIGGATLAFLLADSLAARAVALHRTPRPFDGPWTLVFASAALALPAVTRLLPPDQRSAALVAGLALAIAWGMRLATRLPGGARSNAWLDSTGIPALLILFFALWLSIPWERYAMLASYVWLLHAVFPQLRRAIAMALDRLASFPWGYLLAGAGLALGLAALFAAELDINRESTRMALLVTGYALLSLSIYPRRAFPAFAAFFGCFLIGGYLVVYCRGGGEYHPGPAPAAGETLLSADRGDVLDWAPFPANGEEVLERIARNNPEAYARLMPIIKNASCERRQGLDRGRACAAYSVTGALYDELRRLIPSTSNHHLAQWTLQEAQLRESQFRRRSGACSSQAPQFSPLDPLPIQRAHAALVLDIVASGPRPLAERREVPLPDLATFQRAQQRAAMAAAAIEGGPLDPRLHQHCIVQIIRARTISSFGTNVAARISRGGYPQ